jgi:hypothetical protein
MPFDEGRVRVAVFDRLHHRPVHGVHRRLVVLCGIGRGRAGGMTVRIGSRAGLNVAVTMNGSIGLHRLPPTGRSAGCRPGGLAASLCDVVQAKGSYQHNAGYNAPNPMPRRVHCKNSPTKLLRFAMASRSGQASSRSIAIV